MIKDRTFSRGHPGPLPKLRLYLPFAGKKAGSIVPDPSCGIPIAIIGGGLAGSTAAAMLGHAGIPSILIDPHQTYPFDFRVEKLCGVEQLQRFAATGLAESVLRSATWSDQNWIARSGYLLDKTSNQQFGIMYDKLVAVMRAEISVGIHL
ncbi:FAD-dependent monooxygenase [Bradyrhizobium macuxiense]|uniref:FAD-dependent monooxygenase n=1 Tax=Bradyrhizobium macuxiense TaxID=1755647 RepID=UPI00082D3CEF